MARVGHALVSLFFLALIGQYAYREAKREDRSSPRLRGVFWVVFAIGGVLHYLVRIHERNPKRLGWVGGSSLLIGSWAIGTLGFRGVSGGFYLWGALFAGLFVLYWQFGLEREKLR